MLAEKSVTRFAGKSQGREIVDVSGNTSVREFFATLIRNKSLLRHLIKREIVGRYRGSILGILWSFINPLVMLAVYTVVFGYVFQSRWGVATDNVHNFALVLFAGLIVFNLFSECVSRAPNLILSNVNYVKKVVFPLELLPWVSLGAALFHFIIGLSVVVVFNLVVNHTIEWTIIFLPVLLFPLGLLIVGVSWFLASLGVFLRDISQVIGLVLSVLLFLSPLFYPVSAVPEPFRALLYANPLTYVIDQARGLILWGRLPSIVGLAQYSLSASVTAYLGFYFFQRARKGFADVL
jgi:lipopolysaccharide transport system permease protein